MGLAVVGATLDGTPVGLRAVEGLIAAVGPGVTPQPGDEVVEAKDKALVTGLVNGHTHAAMTLFRGFGDDLPLMEWLETRIWPAEARLTADDVYWGTRWACVEMIRSGTTTFFDMYWYGEAVARAVADSGLRAVVSAVLFDHHDPARALAMRDEALLSLEELGHHGTRVRPGLGPHAIYTVSDGSLEWIAETASARGVPVQIHLAETRGEVEECLEAHGVPPAVHLDRIGLLGPGTVLAHGNWLSTDELHLVAERGATIVLNPSSNLKLANGRIFPYPEALAAGVPLGLGTDGAASNNSLDLFGEMKIFALTQKHAAADPSVAPAAEALGLAAGQRSSLLGGGPIQVGAAADFLLVRTDVPEMVPGDFTADLVYSASGHVVDTTVVAGRVIMRERVVEQEDEIRAEVLARAARLTGARGARG